MRKLRVFWRTFVRSLTDFSYYKEILHARFSFSLKYLFLLLYFISLIGATTAAYKLAIHTPKIPAFVSQVKKVAKDLYPSELVLTVKDNELSTNVKEPYFIPMPQDLRNIKDLKDADISNFKNLVAIDTSANIEDYLKYNAFVLVTKKSVVVPDSNNGYKIYFLDQYEGLKKESVFSRADYDSMYAVVLPYLDFIQPLAIVILLLLITIVPLVWTVFILLWKLMTLFVTAFILWILSIIMGKALDYKDAYRLSMHGITINIVLGSVLGIIGSYLNTFLSLIIFLTFMYFVLKSFPEAKKAASKT